MKINYISFCILFIFFISCGNDLNQRLERRKFNTEKYTEIPEKLSADKTYENSNSYEGNAYLKVLSWNIQDFGRTLSDSELREIANYIKDFDIVAIQEISGKDYVAAQRLAFLHDELNIMGFKWDYVLSDPTNSESAYISERYAVLWKTSKLKSLKRGKLVKELENVITREPQYQSFEFNSNKIHLYNFHSIRFDQSPENEIEFLLNYLNATHTSELVILLGDFNLQENHEVFQTIYNVGYKSALKNQPTTLKKNCKNGIYMNNTIDNIYFSQNLELLESGVIDFVENCDELEEKRKISDHLPIYSIFKLKK